MLTREYNFNGPQKNIEMDETIILLHQVCNALINLSFIQIFCNSIFQKQDILKTM